MVLDQLPLRLRHVFTVPIVEHRWPDSDALNSALKDVILRRETASAGERMSNAGGWHSTGDFETWAGEPGQALIQRVGQLVNGATAAYYKLVNGRDPIRWRITLWANVNRRGHYNRHHIHPGATWSGVYYVDVGDIDASTEIGGRLMIRSPNVAAAMTFFPGLTPDSHQFTPEPGLMIGFPSYLPHEVTPYFGERPRISVAFNVKSEPFPP